MDSRCLGWATHKCYPYFLHKLHLNLSLIYALNDDAIHSFIEGQPCFKHLREAGNVTYMQLDILSWEPNTNSFQYISSYVLEA